jgi:N utilization substance protein B
VQNSRRAARELALKVLFQVDVGKQPLSDVLGGVSTQIRANLDSAVNQSALEAQTALKTLSAQRIDEAKGRISTQSIRQIKTVATTLSNDLRALAVEMSRIAADLAERPIEGGDERAIEQAREAAETTRAAIQRVGSRESLYPDVVRGMADTAAEHSVLMEEAFAKQISFVQSSAAYTRDLVMGVEEKRREIDALLAERSKGWALERQAAVDRNIMRLAAYEILFVPDIPSQVSINEAVDLARKYSTAESDRFVNGVLGALAGPDSYREGANPAKNDGILRQD